MKKTGGKMKLWLRLLGVIVIIAAVTGGVLFYQINQYQKKVADISYSGIDISTIPDGVYTGSCDTGMVSAKVEVTVKEGVITGINLLEHKNGRGAAAEVIGQRIVEQQRVDVDAVSGATNSSKVIKKAVDNALNRV